ncbi:FecR domain-containing protein [Pseudomonas schmalbachii]|uniref:FecR domain-containing protein n=1 Tax=Pseudomonas schmalbachii TaxID=2816993 RepID=A0ABS3TWU7_9PSED|nr:FecR domain-containing protein [Pseudomonas schmalbachii]MBO3278156.1 FecR domain-containing protein [Pseudomonas schmalbachii]
MPTPDSRPLDPAIVDQAIHWLVRLRFNPADAETSHAFEHWHCQHPEHALAWQRVAGLGDDFARLPPALARDTLQGARRRMSRRDSLKVLGLLLGSGSLAWLGREHTPLPELFAEQRTGTGERRRVTLDDGSRLQLNSGSAVDREFDDARRLLVLRRGELIVETGADPRSSHLRPLWVRTRDGYLRALGTHFLVRERQDGTLLSVREGAVAVFPGQGQRQPAQVIRAGQSILFDERGMHSPPDLGLDPWSWSDEVLSARNARLADFLAELARHRPGLLRCSAAAADLRVSGVYQLADTGQVLALLARALPIRVDTFTPYWVSVDSLA